MRESRLFASAIGVALALVLGACTTTGHFKIPQDTQLEVYRRPVTVASDGTVTTSPFFWTAAGGIEYRVLKDGKVLKQGRLRPKFRVVSIFWPPLALIYWPMGLNPAITCDLVNDTQK